LDLLIVIAKESLIGNYLLLNEIGEVSSTGKRSILGSNTSSSLCDPATILHFIK
jgi:hypothetical protein